MNPHQHRDARIDPARTHHLDVAPKPVLRRLLLPLTAMVVVLTVGAGALLLELHQDQLSTKLEFLSSLAADDLRASLAEQAAGLAMAIQPIAADPRVQAALRSANVDQLLNDWGPLYVTLHRSHGLTHFYFFDAQRVCLLRVHKPEKRGDRIDRFTARQAERTGQLAAGLELGPLGTFTLRVVQPVFDGETLLGYVELGKEIEDALGELNAHSGNDTAVIIGKSFLDRKTWEEGMHWLGREADWDRLPNHVVIYASQEHLPDAVTALIDADGLPGQSSSATTHRVDIAGQPWRVSLRPLRDVAGQEVGALILMRNVAPEQQAFTRLLTIGGVSAALLLVVLLGFILFLLRQTDRAIRHQHDELRAERDLFSAGPVFTLVRDLAEPCAVRQVSSNIAAILGYSASDMLAPGFRYDELMHPEDAARVLQERADHIKRHQDKFEQSYRLQTNAGDYRWCYDFSVLVRTPAGEVESIRSYLFDQSHIKAVESALKEHQRQLEHIAHYDALTTLPNRVLLIQRLHQAMAQSQWSGKTLSVAYLDLDEFKAINDSHGHATGDQVLIALAVKMKLTLREGDTLARLGGDEFVAVLGELPAFDACVPLVKRLLAAAATPVQVDGRSYRISASIGVAHYPQADPVDADHLLRQADQAMYQAKLAGRNGYHLFDSERDRSVRTLHESLERISHALSEREFVLYYQPKVNLRTGEVVGLEALIRWQHPQRGLLPPAAFLPLIEDHELAVQVGDWVIDTALTQMAQWRVDGLDVPVSVNVGAHQLQQANFVERLRAQLATHPGVPAERFELEILETSALEDLSRVSQILQDCRAFGINCALDDFGTGYSSLTYLKRLPVAQLKIDQSFVRDMIENTDDLAIVESVVGLAAAFHRQALAEGMETLAHGELLLQLGCELAQGYGIARPMPAQQIPEWIRDWRPAPGWANLSKASHDDLSLVYAGVDLYAWIAAIERYLSGERDALPTLGHQSCRLSTWLNAEGHACHSGQPGFQRIEALHWELHTLAERLVDLKVQGRQAEALSELDELHRVRDALVGELHGLMAG